MFNNIKQTTIKTAEGTKEIQFYLLPASKGFTTAMKLMRMMSGMSTEESADMMTMVSVVVDNLDDTEIMDIIANLTRQMTVEGKEIKFDDYFMGNYGELIQVLSVMLKENFGSFFTVDLSEIL